MTADREPIPLTREEVAAVIEPFFADVLALLRDVQADITRILVHLDGEHGTARESVFDPMDPAGGPL